VVGVIVMLYLLGLLCCLLLLTWQLNKSRDKLLSLDNQEASKEQANLRMMLALDSRVARARDNLEQVRKVVNSLSHPLSVILNHSFSHSTTLPRNHSLAHFLSHNPFPPLSLLTGPQGPSGPPARRPQ
jgi:hypothetical protein